MLKTTCIRAINAFWREKSLLAWCLQPLAWCYQIIIIFRYYFYQLWPTADFKVPIIVVGNLTVGGTGKTPFVIWLSETLKAAGFTPGIVLRGYRGQETRHQIIAVTPTTSVKAVGDEAVLLAKKTNSPVFAGRKRPKVVAKLLKAHPEVDIIISDDGLQHYALKRDIEIVLVDGTSRFGNGYCLPIGPLREPIRRLQRADFVVTNGQARASEWAMECRLAEEVVPLKGEAPKALSTFKGQPSHAVAALGNPDRFFTSLMEAGIKVTTHRFADHHFYNPQDFTFGEKHPILMTEKDAVKCQDLPLDDAWVVPLEVKLPIEFTHELLRKLSHG